MWRMGPVCHHLGWDLRTLPCPKVSLPRAGGHHPIPFIKMDTGVQGRGEGQKIKHSPGVCSDCQAGILPTDHKQGSGTDKVGQAQGASTP